MRAGLWVIAVLASLALPAQAQTERERIASERAAAIAQFTARQRECQAQFVVTACVDAAQREEHSTLTRLRREEQALNDAQRRETAARRRAELAEHAAVQAGRGGDAASAPPREATRKPLAASAASAASRPDASGRAHAAPSAAEQRVDEQRNQASFAAKQRAAQEHRAAVERRNAQRAAEGKVAAPLPVPKGASAP